MRGLPLHVLSSNVKHLQFTILILKNYEVFMKHFSLSHQHYENMRKEGDGEQTMYRCLYTTYKAIILLTNIVRR